MAKALEIKNANPKVLAWAREGIGLDVEEAAKKIKIPKTVLEDLEAGKQIPTKAQLVKLAKVYKRPWALFLLSKIPEYTKKKPYWRTLPNLMESLSFKSLVLIRRAEDLQEIFFELRGMEKSGLVSKKIESSDDPETIGSFLRKTLEVEVKDQAGWEDMDVFDMWRSKVERHGIMVIQSPLAIKEMRAFSIVENSPFVICISSNDNVNAKTFSLFHELTHILLRDSSLCKLGDFSEYHSRQVEVFCNQVAACFLVPKEDITNHPLVQGKFQREWADKDLSVLSKRYRVSREVVLRRLVTLKFAIQTFYEEKKAEWDKIPPKKSFGINRDSEARMVKGAINANGYAFTSAVLENINSGAITLSLASDYLKLKPKYISRLETVFNWNA